MFTNQIPVIKHGNGKSFLNGGLIYGKPNINGEMGDAFPLPYLIEIIQLGPALEPQRCHLGHFSGHDAKQKKMPGRPRRNPDVWMFFGHSWTVDFRGVHARYPVKLQPSPGTKSEVFGILTGWIGLWLSPPYSGTPADEAKRPKWVPIASAFLSDKKRDDSPV